MRDDIHKSVPRPYATQRWVRCSVNDADRMSERPYEALHDSMKDTCRRELSPAFVKGLTDALNAPAQLFKRLEHVTSPRDLGGRGGPAEWETLNEAKRLIAAGATPGNITRAALAAMMKSRVEADIRVTAAVFPRYDKKTPVVLDSMRADAGRVDYGAFAESVCNGQAYESRARARRAVDLDADLRAPGPRP